jgi:hypothetical protein
VVYKKEKTTGEKFFGGATKRLKFLWSSVLQTFYQLVKFTIVNVCEFSLCKNVVHFLNSFFMAFAVNFWMDSFLRKLTHYMNALGYTRKLRPLDIFEFPVVPGFIYWSYFSTSLPENCLTYC